MSLQKVGKYNAIPKSAEVTPLKAGEVARYRYLGGGFDPNTNKHLYPAQVGYAGTSRFKNPDKDGDWIEITLATQVDAIGNLVPESFRNLEFHPSRTGGIVSFVGGHSKDMDDHYEFVERSSQTLSNPYRDTSVTPLLERIVPEADAKKARQAEKDAYEAYGKAVALDKAGVERTAFLYGFDAAQDEEVLRHQIEQVAKADGTKFLQRLVDNDADSIVLIKQAIIAGVLTIDSAGMSLRYVDKDGKPSGQFANITADDMDTAARDGARALMDGNEGKNLTKNLLSLIKQQSK